MNNLIMPSGFEATNDEKKQIESWFKKFDELSLKNDVEGMARVALFPLQVITHDSQGNAYTEIWQKSDFVAVMKAAMEETPDGMQMNTSRTPFVLSDSLLIVVTKANLKISGETSVLKYGDVLVKADGEWKFQTMAQAGWGDLLKSRRKQNVFQKAFRRILASKYLKIFLLSKNEVSAGDYGRKVKS